MSKFFYPQISPIFPLQLFVKFKREMEAKEKKGEFTRSWRRQRKGLAR